MCVCVPYCVWAAMAAASAAEVGGVGGRLPSAWVGVAIFVSGASVADRADKRDDRGFARIWGGSPPP